MTLTKQSGKLNNYYFDLQQALKISSLAQILPASLPYPLGAGLQIFHSLCSRVGFTNLLI